MHKYVYGASALSALLSLTACTHRTTSIEAAPTYHKDIAPLVGHYCGSCHTEGGIAPFSLSTFSEVKEHALSIKDATASRIMPPFLADGSGDCQTYRDSRWLTDQQINMFAQWVNSGTPEGNIADQKPTTPIETTLSEVSVRLDIGVDYTPSPQEATPGASTQGAHNHMHDDYRCFIVDPALTSDKYLTAFQARPGAISEVHHIILFAIDKAEAEAEALSLEAEDTLPGYQCFGGSRVSSGTRPVGGWAPGTPVTRYPATTGVKLSKARKMILQVHYNLDNGMSPDRTTFDLELADSVEKPTQILPLAQLNLNLQPGMASVNATARMVTPIAAKIWGVFPHMHTLGQSLNVGLTRNGKTTCVTNVHRWDFNWQQSYFYETPIAIEAGDTVTLTCNYNTTSRTDVVHWGEGTSDEMCLVFTYVTDLPFTISY